MCNCKDSNCSSNDYSLQTAHTGIVSISTANPNLDGSGALGTVITGSGKGTLIKSVIIKATGAVTTGMVRLFVGNGTTTSLYKEVPIQTTPQLASTPTPTPLLQNYEITLAGGLKLQNGDHLFASTQNSETFNVIAEGMDWQYPGTLPSTCCNFKQDTAENGVGILSATDTIVPIYTAPSSGTSNGSLIKSVTIKALQSTNDNNIIKLHLSSDGGTTYKLMREIVIPQTQQSGFEPSFKFVLDADFNLNAGYVLGASTHLPQGFALTVEAISWSYPIN